jgi:hypothetical protein
VLIGTVVAAQRAPDVTAFDVILRHGTVIDGSGLPRYHADVAIANGFVARVGNLSNERRSGDRRNGFKRRTNGPASRRVSGRVHRATNGRRL